MQALVDICWYHWSILVHHIHHEDPSLCHYAIINTHEYAIISYRLSICQSTCHGSACSQEPHPMEDDPGANGMISAVCGGMGKHQNHVCIYIYIHIFDILYMYIYIYINMHIYIYYTYSYIDAQFCIHIHDMYTNMHIHNYHTLCICFNYIYIYIHTCIVTCTLCLGIVWLNVSALGEWLLAIYGSNARRGFVSHRTRSWLVQLLPSVCWTHPSGLDCFFHRILLWWHHNWIAGLFSL